MKIIDKMVDPWWPGEIMDLVIDRRDPFDPKTFAGLNSNHEIDEQDERSLAINKLDLSEIDYLTYHEDHHQRRETGEEAFSRMKTDKSIIRLDAKILQFLYQNPTKVPICFYFGLEQKASHILFDGTVLKKHNVRFVLGLSIQNGNLVWYPHYMSARRPRGYLSATLRT